MSQDRLSIVSSITAMQGVDTEFCLIHALNELVDPDTLLAPLLSGEADVVIGSRGVNHSLVNKLTGFVCGHRFSDVESGCIAFRTLLGQSVPSRSNSLPSEMLVQFSRRHARFAEVAIPGGVARKIPFAASTLWRICAAKWFSAAHTDVAADMLVAMSGARRFNQWMADTVSPWVKGDVLELGAGIGNLTIPLAPSSKSYTATDTDEEGLATLRSRTGRYRNVRVAACDFLNPNDVEALRGSADTVVCLNVLEHVSDDLAGLTHIRSCLRADGRAIVLVPNGPNAYGSLDEMLLHKRRYTSHELQQKMLAAGLHVENIIEFNRMTYPGWYLNSRLLRRRTLSRVQLTLFDALVPMLKRIDSRLPWPSTSLIAIGTAHGTG